MRMPGVGKVSAVADQAILQLLIHVQNESMEEESYAATLKKLEIRFE